MWGAWQLGSSCSRRIPGRRGRRNPRPRQALRSQRVSQTLRDGHDCAVSSHCHCHCTLQFAKHFPPLKCLCSFPIVSPRVK